MSMTSDSVSIFYEDPTFANLLEATPSLFTQTIFAVLGLASKALGIFLIWLLFVAIHVVAFIDAVLMLFVVMVMVSAAVCPWLRNFMNP